MKDVKDSLCALVRIAYDGRVHKTFRGPSAQERFENECRVLRHLEERGCTFVPRLLDADADALKIVTTNCGARVERLDDTRVAELFAELLPYKVRHDDPFLRNVTYRSSDGRFCLIDFEFASILTTGLRWYGLSDVGRVRKNNEDSFVGLRFDARELHRLGKSGEVTIAETDFAFAVSDGMGGAKSGEFASQITVDKITRLLPRSFSLGAAGLEAGVGDVLTELVHQIHGALIALGKSYDECSGMGATLSLCWFSPSRVFFAHVGDSRIYYLPAAGGLKQLTQDDTFVGWLFRNGKLNEREAREHPGRHSLQKALGAGNQFVDPQLGAVRYEVGDRFLLCSDGLIDGLFDSQLEELLRTPTAAEAALNPAQRLVAAAVRQSGRDNTTALVIEAF